jgi:hypothetical protein
MSKKEISTEVIEMSKVIRDGIELDSISGIVTEVKDVYKNCLPGDLSMETVVKVHGHDTMFVAAATHAVGEIAIKAMHENSKLDSISGHLKMSKNSSLDLDIARSKVYANSFSEDKTPITKYGVVTLGVQHSAGKKSGELKLVYASINEEAAKVLNK